MGTRGLRRHTVDVAPDGWDYTTQRRVARVGGGHWSVWKKAFHGPSKKLAELPISVVTVARKIFV